MLLLSVLWGFISRTVLYIASYQILTKSWIWQYLVCTTCTSLVTCQGYLPVSLPRIVMNHTSGEVVRICQTMRNFQGLLSSLWLLVSILQYLVIITNVRRHFSTAYHSPQYLYQLPVQHLIYWSILRYTAGWSEPHFRRVRRVVTNKPETKRKVRPKNDKFLFSLVFEKLGPGTKSKAQVQRRSLGPKHFTKFGLPTHPTHKLLGHFRCT